MLNKLQRKHMAINGNALMHIFYKFPQFLHHITKAHDKNSYHVNDYEKIKDIKLVLLTARSEIKPEQLTDKENTRAKLQLTYSEDFNGDTEWERQLGYCYCYIVDLENKSYTLRIEEPLY